MWDQTMTISRLVDRVLSPRTELLDSETPVIGDLVIALGDHPLAALIVEGGGIMEEKEAEVTGVARPLVAIAPERLRTQLAG